jgi:hypothetical protein
MADVITGSGNVGALFTTDFVSREVGESLQGNSVIARTVWIEHPDASLIVKFGFLPALNPTAFTDTTGMALVGFNPTSTNTTASPIGVAVRVTGIAQALRPSLLAEVAQEQGRGLAAKIDSDLASVFPSFSVSVGATTTAMTVASWLTAIGDLNKAKVPQNDRQGVLGATGYSDLLNSCQAVNQFAFTEAAKSGQIPVLFGVPVYMSNVLSTANAGADNVGGMYHRRAIGLGILNDIQSDVQKAPAQFNATDIASVAYYGVAALDPARGIKFISRA